MAARLPIEQDRGPALSEDGLPTYEHLAEQEGPQSRFGRWAGWIEKRALERHAAITPEERARRRARGWGNDEMDALDPEPPTPTPDLSRLSIQTDAYSLLSEPPPGPDSPLPRLPVVSTHLHPTHLKMNHFGSRFLPHSTAPIRCLLPLQADQLLLIGHDEGLSVLDMFPQDWTEDGHIQAKGPEDARVYPLWVGESVFQMSFLEQDENSGVVLVLVGPESESPGARETEHQRVVRMYKLASLLSLAKYAVAHKGSNPVSLDTFATLQTTPKKHRPTSSIARGLKSLIPPSTTENSAQSYQALLSPAPSLSASRAGPQRINSDESTRSWEVVDDLPMRWARDFVPLAAPGSRLFGQSVITFSLWDKSEGGGVGGLGPPRGQFLAIATKNNILLYETPPNERAFQFVKEFYTPLQSKSITFFQQTVHDVVAPERHRRTPSRGSQTTSYSTQLSIFVVFEKKAGWIRLADSAVGEMELFDHGFSAGASLAHNRTLSVAGSGTPRRHASAIADGSAGTARWIPPTRCELPNGRSVYLLTRGSVTHVAPSPLSSHTTGTVPLGTVPWRTAPSWVVGRVSPSEEGLLQLTALGEGSIEVVELPIASLLTTKGSKGKGKDMTLRVEEDAGGETGFLCAGGYWDQSEEPGLHRTYSTASYSSTDSEEVALRYRRQVGFYGWCRKGLSDWRVFWLGGTFEDM
ncbi:unnamed protein product [Mycena citricolor]|uniref:Uncharacterized protein n=1 Tax=Mycena citricolor TaxID=2018698 RepID=A0AAD2GVQ5_9AGAR|nr:unnamed protein product [Mycena citricolor]